MKTVVLYTRRNVGLCALSYLVAQGLVVKVISDDENVLWMADCLGCEIITIETMGDDFDIFICVHGNKIIPKEYLVVGKSYNIHPCLYKYSGHNPIRRYIINEDTEATIEAQEMILEVDAGKVIHREDFYTGKCVNYADFYNIALPYYFKTIDRLLKIVL